MYKCADTRYSAVQVSRAEFMMFILMQLELVPQDELRNINRMFDTLDSDGSGDLTIHDIRLKLKEAESQAQPQH